jgi:hypothetical protein
MAYWIRQRSWAQHQPRTVQRTLCSCGFFQCRNPLQGLADTGASHTLPGQGIEFRAVVHTDHTPPVSSEDHLPAAVKGQSPMRALVDKYPQEMVTLNDQIRPTLRRGIWRRALSRSPGLNVCRYALLRHLQAPSYHRQRYQARLVEEEERRDRGRR